jgi:hypothetical protein
MTITPDRLVTRPVLVGRSTGAPATGFAEPVEPVHQVEPVEPVEPAPAESCPPCANCASILPALARIEDVLTSILLDVSELRSRVDDMSGIYDPPPYRG